MLVVSRRRPGAQRRFPRAPALTQADLPPIIHEPIARRTSAGWDAAAVARLMQVRSVSGDQPDSYLGAAELNRVYFDHNAAGHGRFLIPRRH